MTEAEFLQKHLPPPARSGHEVLYDFDERFQLSPTTAQLASCVEDLVPLLQAAKFGPELYEAGHDASELVLSLLARASHQGTPMPTGPGRDAAVSECLRLLSGGGHPALARRFQGIDALKRLQRILSLLGVES